MDHRMHKHVVNNQRYVSASYHQERLWFIDRFESGYLYTDGPVYHNIPMIIDFNGEVDEVGLQKCILALIGEHAILHTRIVEIDGVPFQEIMTEYKIEMDSFVVLSANDKKEVLDRQIKKAFSLSDPLIRVSFIKTDKRATTLLVVIHHIIADQYTVRMIAKEILVRYANYLSGTSIDLVNKQVQFATFSTWQRDSLMQSHAHLLSFWRQQLDGPLKALEFPTDRPRAAVHIYQAADKKFNIPRDQFERLLILEKRYAVSVQVILMAAFNVLLYKYCGHEEIVIGTSVDNREGEFVDVAGPIANLLVIRSWVRSGQTFLEYILALNKIHADTHDHHRMPFDKLVTELAPEKDMSRTALFDVLFQYAESKIETPLISGLDPCIHESHHGYGKYDLNILFKRLDHEVEGSLIFNHAYFDLSTIELFVSRFLELLRNLLTVPEQQIANAAMITAEEKRSLRAQLDYSRVAYPQDKSVIDFFLDQVRRSPNRVAAKFQDQHITYAELDLRSTKLAHLLKEQGHTAHQIIALVIDRSIDMVVGMLGILKSGAAYLPIDIAYPTDRINYLIQDSGARFALTTRLSDLSLKVPTVFIEDWERVTDENLIAELPQPCDLCYVIYTSGTTGNPKGVMIEHRNVVRLFFNEKFQFEFSASDVWTMFHSHSFDFSVWELYGALLFGGTVIIIPKLIAKDTKAYRALLERERVTVLNQTPSAFYSLVQEELLHSKAHLQLRYVIFGGESLSPAKLKDWHARYPSTMLINMFGITETTVHVTYKEIGEYEIENNINSIGKPIPTSSVYLLDDHQNLVPAGITGELYVGGAGVARGYLNREELTREKFIPNPFNGEERLYRSGDLARIIRGEELEYLGRIDHQVQLRGFRIELSEIESQLLAHQQVSEAVVIAREKGEEKHLIAYYVSTNPIKISELRTFLLSRVPDHMVPSFWVHLLAIPLTANGKLDRKALPDPQLEAVEETEFPSSGPEETLAAIWADVLKIDRKAIGVNKSFFELGGDSLNMLKVIAKAKNKGIPLTLKQFMEAPYIAALWNNAQPVSEVSEDVAHPINNEMEIDTTEFMLSPIQQWFFENNRDNVNFIMHASYHLDRNFSKVKLKHSLELLHGKYDAFRLRFKRRREVWLQYYTNAGPLYHFDDFSHEPDINIEKCISRALREINSETGPMSYVCLFTEDSKSIIFIACHHLIMDAVSWQLLMQDLEIGYAL
jgi:amino acid adenylation domain-containing protein